MKLIRITAHKPITIKGKVIKRGYTLPTSGVDIDNISFEEYVEYMRSHGKVCYESYDWFKAHITDPSKKIEGLNIEIVYNNDFKMLKVQYALVDPFDIIQFF